MKEISQVCTTSMFASSVVCCFLVGYLAAQEPPVPVKDEQWLDTNWSNKHDTKIVVVEDPDHFGLPNRRRQPETVKAPRNEEVRNGTIS